MPENPLGPLYFQAFFFFGLGAGAWWYVRFKRIWNNRFWRYVSYTYPMFLAFASFLVEVINWKALIGHEYMGLGWKILGFVAIPFIGLALYGAGFLATYVAARITGLVWNK